MSENTIVTLTDYDNRTIEIIEHTHRREDGSVVVTINEYREGEFSKQLASYLVELP